MAKKIGDRMLNLRSLSLRVAVTLGLVPVAALAQESNAPVRISITAGFSNGPGVIWSVDDLPKIVQEIVPPARPPRRAQSSCPAGSRGLCRLIESLIPSPPSCVRVGCPEPMEQFDTLALSQEIGLGSTGAVAFAARITRHFRLGGTLALTLFRFERSCRLTFAAIPVDGSAPRSATDDPNPNPANCATVDARDGMLAVIDLMPFVQFNPIRDAYFRFNAGASRVPGTASMRTQFRTFVDAGNSGAIRPAYQLSFGIEPPTWGGDLTAVIGFRRHLFDGVTFVGEAREAQLVDLWHDQLVFMLGYSFTTRD